jgi:DNA polymerase
VPLFSEQALWTLDQQINRRGFYTDGVLLNAARHVVTETEAALQTEFRELTGLDSTNQTAKLIAWLAEHDCPVTDVQKGTLKHALRRKGLQSAARRAIELRLQLAHASAGKVEALLAWRDADGRVRGTLKFHGAGTGRWTGHGPQPQNFKRDGEDIEAKAAAVATGDLAHVAKLYPQPLEIVGDIARAMICAAPERRLLIGDFSGIESRVLAWVSGQQSKLEQWGKFDRTGNPKDEPYYTLGRSCGQSEELARKIGKTADLAFGYMGGPGAWDRLAPEDDATSDTDKRRYQLTWRSLHQQTVQFWAGINRAAICAVNKPGITFSCRRLNAVYDGETFLRITLPSGRSLSYPFPRLAPDKFSNAMVMFKDNAAGKFVDCRYGQGAYGGLWTENIVQAVSRDLLAAAMVRLEAAGHRVVLHVHDEIVAEVPTDFGGIEEFQRLITVLLDWAEGLPIAAKVRAGARFCKPETPAAKPNAAIPDDLRIPGFLLRCPAPPIAAAADEDVDKSKPDGKLGDDHASIVPDELAAILAAAGGNDDSGASVGLHADDHGVHHGNDQAGAPETEQDVGTANDGGNSGVSAGNGRGHDYPHGERRAGRRLATYLYCDLLKGNHTRVEKWQSSTAARAQYPQFFWSGGRWVSQKPKGWMKVPYRLPELLEALAKDPGADVFLPEGEKDAEMIAALGLVATTNSEGATPLKAKIGKWAPELNKWFYGVRRLFIPADNDEVGRAFAREKARALEAIVPDIRIVLFPDVPESEDVSYWLNKLGHTKTDLLVRCEAAERWQDSITLESVRASAVTMEVVDWLWPDRFALGEIGLLVGLPDEGKGQILSHIAARVTRGLEWPNGEGCAPQGSVILLTSEDDIKKTVTPRLVAASADCDRVEIIKMVRDIDKQGNPRERMFSLIDDLQRLRRKIAEVANVTAILIDPVSAYLGIGKVDSYRGSDVRAVLGPLKALAEDLQIAVIGIMHFNKKVDITNVLLRTQDSLAFVAAPRHVFGVVDDADNNRKLMVRAKNNLVDSGQKRKSLAFHFEVQHVGTDPRNDKPSSRRLSSGSRATST